MQVICCLVKGRASGSPTMDVFITLLSIGRSGYLNMVAERKSLFEYLQNQLSQCAVRHGERLMSTKHNPISLGTVLTIARLFFPECTVYNKFTCYIFHAYEMFKIQRKFSAPWLIVF